MKTNIHVLNVGHGDAILVRVKRSSTVWTMLIDGGRSHARVGQRLKPLIPETDNARPRIDLLVASHHDQDHLEGLIDLIESDEFEIGEAWAPVVFHPRFDPTVPDSGELTLTQELLKDERAEERVYAQIERALQDLLFPDAAASVDEALFLARLAPQAAIEEVPADIEIGNVWGDFPLISLMVRAGHRLGGIPSCGQPFPGIFSENFDPLDDVPQLGASIAAVESQPSGLYQAYASPAQLDHLRLMAQATAKTASYIRLTARFIKATSERGIPTTVQFAQLNGQRWCTVGKSGLGPWKDREVDRGLRIELLSPTKWLAKKLKDKLTMPPGELRLAMAMNSVTVTNRVSYVFNLHAGKATAMFTGDSGFTDFHEGGQGNFHDDRVARIGAADWIKVPHHAGHFHRFARAVEHLRDGLGMDTDGKWFVTSLGEKVPNPSLEFEELARKLRDTAGKKPIFDFTNGPVRERFDAICANCPRAGIDGKTDLHYTSTTSGGWRRVSPTKEFCCTNYR